MDIQQQPVNPNQVNTSILGMTSAVFTSVAATLVTTAVKSNTFIDKTFNVAIHGVAAAEHIAAAAESRAQIYAQGVVRNGVLQERETELKHILRLRALEAQELASRVQPSKKPATAAKPKTESPPAVSQAAITEVPLPNGALN